jgi:hypothetical protein
MDTPRKSLRERAEELQTRLPIMGDREKGNMDDLLDKPVTIREFDFMTGVLDKKTRQVKPPFAVFTVEEAPGIFFFGGMVLTDILQKFKEEGYEQDIKDEGLPVMFKKVKSQDNQMYTNVLVYPVTDDDVIDASMGVKKKK